MEKVNVKAILNSNSAITSEGGDLVFEKISQMLRKNESVIVDFEGIEIVITAFLNAAIGQLYSQFTNEHIRSLLRVKGLDESDLRMLKMVIDKSKLYFKHREEINKSID